MIPQKDAAGHRFHYFAEFEQAAFNPANIVPGIGFSPDMMPDAAEPPLTLEGPADHWDYRADDEGYYTQPGLLHRLMSPEQQQVLFDDTARALGDAPWRSRSATSATARRPTGLRSRRGRGAGIPQLSEVPA